MIQSLYIDDLQIGGEGGDYRITSSGPGFFGGPIPRTNRPDRAQRDGGIDLTYYYGPRVIELQGIVVGTSVSDALDKLDALKLAFRLNSGLVNDFEQLGVNQGAPLHALKRKLIGRDYFEQLYVSQDASFDAPMDIPNKIIPWGVTLVASDPRWYQIHEEDEDTSPYGDDVTSSGGYLQVELLHGTDTDVTAGGNTPALPWLTAQGPFDDFMRVEMDDGTNPIESDELDLDLGDGNNVDIVTRTRLAIKNQTIRHDIVNRQETDWFELPADDEVNLAFTTGGGTDSGTVCRIRWQVARL